MNRFVLRAYNSLSPDDSRLPLLPGPPALPAAAIQLLRRGPGTSILRRGKEPAAPRPRDRKMLPAGDGDARTAAGETRTVRRLLLPVGLSPPAVPRRLPRCP